MNRGGPKSSLHATISNYKQSWGLHVTLGRLADYKHGTCIVRPFVSPISFADQIQIVEAGLGIGFVGPRFVLVELRNGYSGQNADDGDNYEQPDQGKTRGNPISPRKTSTLKL